MVLSPQDPALLGRATADLDISSADADRCRASYGLTLIAAEAVEELTARDATLDSARPRRNVLTRGLDVNALVGRDPTIGDVRCRGLRPAEPCAGHVRAARSAPERAPRRPTAAGPAVAWADGGRARRP